MYLSEFQTSLRHPFGWALHKVHMADGQNRHDQTVSERRSKHVLYAVHLISVEV